MTDPSHILVVDDDDGIRTLLKKYLTRNGYAVTAARDAAHARRLLDLLAFDLLVIDVMMPGEDGLSLTRSLRETLESSGCADMTWRGVNCGATVILYV